MHNPTTFRAGLIGAGYVSQFHLLALARLPNVTVTGVCDLDFARAQATGCRAFRSTQELYTAGVDVVHVLTPPASHTALTIEALEHGCHVLVEKPLATSVDECDRISAAAVKAGKVVCVNHSLLRDPFIVRALQAVQAGAVGDVLTMDYFRSSEYTPWANGAVPPQYREGGYPFRDLGVHALYLMQAFLGDIRNVTAEFRSAGRLSRDPNLLYDEWRASVRAARGTGQIQISWNVRPMQHVLLVQGTRGVLRADLFGMNVTLKRNTPLPKAIERLTNAISEGCQIQTQVLNNAWRFARKRLLPYHGLQMLVAEFYENLAAGKPTPVTVADARPVVDWTERAAQPADEAKRAFLTRFPTTLTAPVLVTGAAGFIGRRLLQRLLTGHDRVRILVRREPPPEIMNNPRVEVVLGDLGDAGAVDRAVAGTRLVYHAGAAMGGWREDFERSTVAGTKHVVESVLRHRVSKLVYVSSLSVIDWAGHPKDKPVTESAALEPHADQRGFYTQTKLEAEQIVVAATQTRGLNAIVLRPGQVFGPGAPLLTPAVARRMGGRLVILGDGTLVLPLVYVEDVVDAILLAAKSNITDGSLFHIVDTANVTQAQLTTLCEPTKSIVRVPRPIVYCLAFGVESLGKLLKRPVPLSRYRVRSALAPISFDCSLAENRLGWKPRVGVLRGLERTLAVMSSGKPLF